MMDEANLLSTNETEKNITEELKEAASTNVTQAETSSSRETTPPFSTQSLSDMKTVVATPTSLPTDIVTPTLDSPINVSSEFVNISPMQETASLSNPSLPSVPNIASTLHDVTTTLSMADYVTINPQTLTSTPLSTNTTLSETSDRFVPSVLPPRATEMSRTAPSVSTRVQLNSDESSSMGPVYPTSDQKDQGLFGWFSGSSIVSTVMEKTKSSVESVITTLDPGMKEVMHSGGDINLVVTSDKELKISAVRKAFQEIFGRATVYGLPSSPNIAPQPVGYTSAMKGAEERIDNLRRSEKIDLSQAAISIENFIAEILPDRWYDLSCLLLRDPQHNIELQTFSQATPISTEYVLEAQNRTPDTYDRRWSGLKVTIGEVIQSHIEHVDPVDWHIHCTGVSRQTLIYNAALMLGHMYKQRLPRNKLLVE